MPSSALLAVRTLAGTFLAPSRGLSGAASRGSTWPPLLAATLASLLLAAALAPRLDVTPLVEARLEADPAAAQLSPHDRGQRLAQAGKLAPVSAFASALAAPVARALAVALALALAFRVAGASPAFSACLAVAAWALLPLALRDLATLPAALRAGAVTPEEARGLLPSTLAALLPATRPLPLARLLSGLELFLGLVGGAARARHGAGRRSHPPARLRGGGRAVALGRAPHRRRAARLHRAARARGRAVTAHPALAPPGLPGEPGHGPPPRQVRMCWPRRLVALLLVLAVAATVAASLRPRPPPPLAVQSPPPAAPTSPAASPPPASSRPPPR